MTMDNILSQVLEETSDMVFGIWFLIGAALVFFMQAGFAMVETGFTRAKNAGNIIMKNLMDFCIGTIMFIIIGFGLFLGEDLLGFIGKPGFDILTGHHLFSTLYSVQQLQQLFQVQWLKEQNSFHIVCIQQLSVHLFILLKLTGSGAAAGLHSSDSMIMQVQQLSTW